MSKRVAILVQGGNDKFLGPIYAWLNERHEVRVLDAPGPDELARALDWADLAWVEWVQDLAAQASRLPRRGRLVMRLHSFEAYTAWPGQVAWENVDRLAVVAAHVAEIVKIQVPDLAERVRVSVLPNGVDLERFGPGRKRERTGKVAFVGALRHTKNLPLVLQCFAAAAKAAPDLSLHLAGRYEGGDLERMELAVYLHHMIAALGLEDRVRFHGQVEDVAAWLSDKDALISCSIRESFAYNVAEAMARGVRPAVHNFPGARTLYPADLVFETVERCAEILLGEGPTPRELRAFVEKNYSLARQLAALESFLKEALG
ncbi:MAG: glycosyltransferase family 4 protein [Desulfovibrionaceae bacterium]|nr:glycosyltransferase family 4 protein [Desulfovibrionaceae bacterium]